MAVKRNDQAG